MNVHHIAFRTARLERLAEFYETIFQLVRVTSKRAASSEGRSIWYALDGAILMIERGDDNEPPIPTGSLEFIAFSASDVECAAFVARCHQANLPIEHQTPHTVYVRDPDGRRVGVSSYWIE